MEDGFRHHISDEIMRTKQQGLGRPIISTQLKDQTLVVAGDTIHWSKNWKTFPDFLGDYVRTTLGSTWGNAELGKPLRDRHPILQWYDTQCHYQASIQEKQGEVFSGPMTGVSYCYLGLAYNLYLLKHNVELQSRLVARLKDVKQFQGAYYELIVANCLIRAGFQLELEDETDQTTKHCEFSARSIATGKRYWIEAKMRSVPGVLGKTEVDGSTSSDPTSRLSKHLSDALRKPAPDERMIFIDLNAEPTLDGETPVWLDKTMRRLEDRERDLSQGQKAYVFVTNMAFHRRLNDPGARCELIAHGLGIHDFGKVRHVRLPEWYRQKQKHIDAHNLIHSFRNFPQIPSTFDGRPASEVFENHQRLKVGETYFFDDLGDEGLVAKITSIAVNENEKRAYIAILPSGSSNGLIAARDLSDFELADYKKYGDAYFGETEDRNSKTETIFELYEWLIRCYSKTPRAKLLELANDHPQLERLKALESFEIVLELCERWALTLEQGQNGARS